MTCVGTQGEQLPGEFEPEALRPAGDHNALPSEPRAVINRVDVKNPGVLALHSDSVTFDLVGCGVEKEKKKFGLVSQRANGLDENDDEREAPFPLHIHSVGLAGNTMVFCGGRASKASTHAALARAFSPTTITILPIPQAQV